MTLPSFKIYAMLLSCVLIAAVRCPAAERQALRSWQFARFGAMADGSTLAEPDNIAANLSKVASWRTVRVPHDWGIEGPFRQDLHGRTGKLPWIGIGWYQTTLPIDDADRGQRIFLDFDGAMSHAKVYVNGQLVGQRPYGYSSFRIDCTDAIHFDQPNHVAVRLENKEQSSRWYPGAGLYRNVWLVKKPPTHLAHWGVLLRTGNLTDDRAELDTQTTVVNRGATPQTIAVRQEVFYNGKSVVMHQSMYVVIQPGQSRTIDHMLRIAKPVRWSIENPALYDVRTSLYIDDKVTDTTTTHYGFRTAEFTADRGFLLNGKVVQLQGVCRHADLGPLGTAVNVRAMQRQIEILQQMGCNAIRTSHNPVAPEFLDLCDRMGMLVFEEAFDCWSKHKVPNDYAELFDQWHQRDLSDMVLRDRNRPSIVLWSTGNEIVLWDRFDLSQQLADIVHKLDPTRLVTVGSNNTNAGFGGFQKTVDVMGWNYRWKLYADFKKANPDQPLVGSETSSCVSSRGIYFFPVKTGRRDGYKNFQVSSYDLYSPPWGCPPDAEFKSQEQNPWVAGEFIWTGFDYLGEPTPYNHQSSEMLNFETQAQRQAYKAQLEQMHGEAPSRSSYFGAIDLCGFPKDRFFNYQAHWRPNLPMAHLLPHWTWPGREGQITPVVVYTSGDEAELFLNGQSLGRKAKGDFEYRLTWNDVKYQSGELKVVAYKNGKHWAEDVQHTAGQPVKLVATVDRSAIASDGDDIAYITVSAVDADGHFVPTATAPITFTITSPGELVATCNGDSTSHIIFSSPTMPLFSGKVQAIVRFQPHADAPMTVAIQSPGLQTSQLTIQVAPN